MEKLIRMRKEMNKNDPSRERPGWIVFIFLVGIIAAGALDVDAQDEKPQRFFLRGYMKSLQGLYFIDPGPALESSLLLDNLLHNRLNAQYLFSDQLNLKVEMRNRIFYGDIVKSTPGPGFAELVDDVNNDFFDLSYVFWDHNAMVGHAMLDRLYLEYISGQWEVRLGRQRINWGISTVWNPNDIFNAFSFTDFDYEERPGSDALRVRRYLGFASSIEIAAKAFDQWEDAVMALMYRFNQWNYDVQILAGIVEEELVFGLGWAGNLGNAGLKGEATFFQPTEEGAESSFAGTIGIDYSLASGLYLQGGFLYNSNGTTDRSVTGLFDFELSAKNLYPYEYAIFTQVTYPVNPLTNIGMAVIYSPVKVQPLFLNPLITYSISQNWDLDLIGQIVLDEEETYRSPIQALFLRFKWSF
jgi:hypothetical protein